MLNKHWPTGQCLNNNGKYLTMVDCNSDAAKLVRDSNGYHPFDNSNWIFLILYK